MSKDELKTLALLALIGLLIPAIALGYVVRSLWWRLTNDSDKIQNWRDIVANRRTSFNLFSDDKSTRANRRAESKRKDAKSRADSAGADH